MPVVIDTLAALRDSVALNTSILHEIQMNTQDTVANTAHDFYTSEWCLFGILTIVISVFTLIPLWTEFKKDRIDKECQYSLFKDIIRHLYRNKVCSIAMRMKYNREIANSESLVHPSEEHYLKMELLPDDIHVEQFYRDDTKFAAMHHLALLLRNYNIEIEVAQKHIADQHIPAPTIKRDFSTLDLKPGLITNSLIGKMKEIWPSLDKWMDIIRAEHKNNLKNNGDKRLWGNDYSEEIVELIEKELKLNDSYNRLFCKIDDNGNIVKGENGKPVVKEDCLTDFKEFYSMLYEDILIECGKNQNGQPKIHIVKTDLAKPSGR